MAVLTDDQTGGPPVPDMTLTDDEKLDARATDPRAAAIVDRVDDFAPEIFERLHGAIRSLRPAAST